MPWIGRVPSGWQVARLKTIADVRPSGVDKHSIDGEVPVRLCNYVDVYKNDRITADLAFMEATATPSEIERFTLAAGDVLITKDSETPDDIAAAALVERSAEGAVCGYHLALLRPERGRLHGAFLFWSLKGAGSLAQFSVRAQGITRFGLTTAAMGDVLLAVPPPAEQRAIAAFLDRECGKIDALVAEQERLIALLKEKRQAVISHAVTKGLDPTAPMKDSGVAWLGQVPAHWEVKRLKQFVGGVTVGVVVMPSQYYAEEGVPALRSLNVRDMAISMENLVFFSHAANSTLAKSMLRTDDLVAIRTGKPGTTAIVPPELDGANCVDLILIRRSPSFVSRFLGYVMNSSVCHVQYAAGSEGALQQHFNIETAGNLQIALPPLPEQSAITAFLDVAIGDLDTLTTEAERAIALLKERRAALISAAVTGKIDVRGLVAPTAAEAA